MRPTINTHSVFDRLRYFTIYTVAAASITPITSLEVHIFEPEKSCTKEGLQCSMCEAALAETALFVCESGHVVCRACRTPDADNIALENPNAKRTPRNESSMTIPERDLASGDHQRFFKSMRPKPNSICNIKHDWKLVDRQAFSGKVLQGLYSSNKETTLKYKNVNFCDSDSSVSSAINDKEEEFAINRLQRPVTCPMTDCHKIIARDAVMQHFYFDHSKVPRIKIIKSQHHEIFIQLSAITEKLLCYAVFLVSDTSLPRADSSTLINGCYKNSSFLLMGARMPSAEAIKKTRGSESVCSRHVQTQTVAVKTKRSNVHLNKPDSLTIGQDNLRTFRNIDKDGAIMLWICKLGNSAYYYSISVTRPDKKFGFSVTGETTSINDSQDCSVIWNEFDCLLIRGIDAAKLINKERQLELNINIFE